MIVTQGSIVVTGGAGFFGSRVVARLHAMGADRVSVPRSSEYDLVDKEACERLFRSTRPRLVIHMAAKCGGIGANRAAPGDFFYENMAMGMNVVECCRAYDVEKLVLVSTICAYPKHTPVPFKEDQLWNGYPEETNAPYAIAKKALVVMAQAYRQQYDLNTITLLPVNLYGPGDDLDLEKNHVIPALIKKFVDARRARSPYVEVWGSGQASREFLYVEDAALGLVLASERYEEPDPINLGAGFEITIRDLVSKLKELTHYEGDVVWDRTKPDGQPRRCLDVTKAEQCFGFRATTSFDEGLRRTVEWYEALPR
jgi:GDP-L-fucose synthase